MWIAWSTQLFASPSSLDGSSSCADQNINYSSLISGYRKDQPLARSSNTFGQKNAAENSFRTTIPQKTLPMFNDSEAFEGPNRVLSLNRYRTANQWNL